MEKSTPYGHGRTRHDSMMASFYVLQQRGIAFRCFATGILFASAVCFFLVYNGLTIAWWRRRNRAGHGRNLFTFMAGHGAFELTAIVISGAAAWLWATRWSAVASVRAGPRCAPRRATSFA